MLVAAACAVAGGLTLGSWLSGGGSLGLVSGGVLIVAGFTVMFFGRRLAR
jgi:hypothetical protein